MQRPVLDEPAAPQNAKRIQPRSLNCGFTVLGAPVSVTPTGAAQLTESGGATHKIEEQCETGGALHEILCGWIGCYPRRIVVWAPLDTEQRRAAAH